jgi:hypothetical protein
MKRVTFIQRRKRKASKCNEEHMMSYFEFPKNTAAHCREFYFFFLAQRVL